MTKAIIEDWQKAEDGRVRFRRPHTRVVNGVEQSFGVTRFIWSAEEYDLMEDLADKGLTTEAMRHYFFPKPSGAALAAAMAHAKIPGRYARGFSKKPTNVELKAWAEMYIEWCEKQGKAVDQEATVIPMHYVRPYTRVEQQAGYRLL